MADDGLCLRSKITARICQLHVSGLTLNPTKTLNPKEGMGWQMPGEVGGTCKTVKQGISEGCSAPGQMRRLPRRGW